MITPKGPKVIEYNCRFGDPETQVVLPLLETDLLTAMLASTNGTLKDTEIRFSKKNACCVIVASKGYPVKYESGFEIELPELPENGTIFVAGAKLSGEGKLVSAGGRVLGVTAVADTLKKAIDGAYAIASGVRLENGYFRKDIGQRALKAKEITG